MKYFFVYVLFIPVGGYSVYVLYKAWGTEVITRIPGGKGGVGMDSYSLIESPLMFYFGCFFWVAALLVSLFYLFSKPLLALYRKIFDIEEPKIKEENEFLKHQDENDFLGHHKNDKDEGNK